MAIKFHYEYTKDWLIERPAAKDYYDDIVKKAGDAFVNSNTGWEYSGSNTVQYVNPTITTSDNLSIRTIEVHHTTSNYYIRFWLIAPYSSYYISATYFPYMSFNNEESSNELTTGLQAKKLHVNSDNLYSTSSSGSWPKLLPGIFFYAVNNSSILCDFGYNLHTISNLCPLDSVYSLTSSNSFYGYYSGAVRHICEITTDSSGNTILPGGYGKIFWVSSDTSGNYFTFGFGNYNSIRKYDRCFCCGNLLSNLDQSDSNKFMHITDYYIRSEVNTSSYINGSNSASILDRSGRTPSTAGIVSFNNYYSTTLSKLGVSFKGDSTNKTHVTLLNPVQFKFGNTINYTPIRVYTTEYDAESQLISNGQANKGFIDTEYMRYIGTSYPGTSENLWRTFDNKNWMMLCPGWLFRWDQDAPDMRNF